MKVMHGAELLCRMIEAITEKERPAGQTAEESVREVLDAMPANYAAVLRRAARAAAEYFRECSDATRVQ